MPSTASIAEVGLCVGDAGQASADTSAIEDSPERQAQVFTTATDPQRTSEVRPHQQIAAGLHLADELDRMLVGEAMWIV